jgi:hypothetical protein
VVHEAEGVDDRNDDQRAAQRLQVRRAQEAADDLHADHLIAVHPGTDEHRGAVCLAMDHMHRHRYRRVVRQDADGKVNRLSAAGGDRLPVQRERRALRHQPRPLVPVLPGLARFSMCSMILPATSRPVALSTPSSPGEEFTSITTGP